MNSENPDPTPPAAPKITSVLVYACSGGSDAGELADRIARQLAQEGVAQMSCLAGIGGRVKSLVAKAGFKKLEHLGLQDLGLRKGSCSVDEPNTSTGVTAAKKIIRLPSTNINPHASAQ